MLCSKASSSTDEIIQNSSEVVFLYFIRNGDVTTKVNYLAIKAKKNEILLFSLLVMYLLQPLK